MRQFLAGSQIIFNDIKVGPDNAVFVFLSQRVDEVAFFGQGFKLQKRQNVILNFFNIFYFKKNFFRIRLFKNFGNQRIIK